MTTETLTQRPKASDFQADYETRQENARRFNGTNHEDECFLCGRGLTQKAIESGWYIHLGTDGTLLQQDDPAAEADPGLSQGAFPVGSECAKRIARPYKFKMGGGS